jgi:ABC-type glycerol-3-phosphate transport system substrate-binding protein
MKTLHLPALLLAALALSACGGGSSTPAATTDAQVPASAMASPETFTQFTSAQPDSDSSEPMVMDDQAPPTSETAEPAPVS